MDQTESTAKPRTDEQNSALPAISLPKGGGAIRGVGEKFAANPVVGTGSMSVPIATSPGRSGFGPELALSYDSGSGNGPFGFGWGLSLPSITRKTDKGLPQYLDAEESDVFLLSGAEDLVPVLDSGLKRFRDGTTVPGYVIHRYRPRTEGLFARIERWTNAATGEIHWRSITPDNVTTLYGKDSRSRIFDPADPSPATPARIFSWLICESHDDKGNAIVYEYAAENDDNVDRGNANERNRVYGGNLYLKRIKYGNRVSRLIQPDLGQASWMFEVLFDYDEAHYEEVNPEPAADEHRLVRASASAGGAWTVRPDPFSSYRAGFELRTCRRCHRVLMFHHIPAGPAGEQGYDGLVSSTELDYADLESSGPVTIEDELAHQGSTRFASVVRRITQSGYLQDDSQTPVVSNGVQYATYLKKSLPPVEFEYSKAVIHEQVLELDPDSLENLPVGLDSDSYRWVDLHGEGAAGILTEQAGVWFYKRNLSPIPGPLPDGRERVKARFSPLETVAIEPNVTLRGGAEFMDLAGDGQPDVVVREGPTPGLYEHDDAEGWQPFRPFTARLNRDLRDPNLRFIDLDGDGHADVLITEDEAFVWHASLAKAGFGPAQRVAQALDEEQGPRIVFADGTQSIYLADFSGDGLTDIARIRNGEVCYWPNLGYGRFGAKVTMDNAPWFDHPQQFDHQRIRLADIDGSGTIDLIYLHRDGVRLYFNQSGNRLSEARGLAQFPPIDKLSSVTVVDLLGNGTACLVWSSPLPGGTGRQMRYIDLMGGQKPHLLIKSVNNLGAETEVHYVPSTRFYLSDKRDGKPWLTRLPFPVHVVDRVTTHDHISGNRFVTRYAYHHGYFDGVEREFRGFGMVEQWDTEEFAALRAEGEPAAATNIDAATHVPPVLTKTWFHTGVYLGREHVSDFFAGLLDARDVGEYYREPGLSDPQARARLLDDTVLPEGLAVDEAREACRTLKGAMLRQEVYALDGTDQQPHPYTVTEQNLNIRMLQPRGGNRHGVFFTHAHESLSYHYERNPADPRIGHTLTLEVDAFGNILKSAAIGYGRRQPDQALALADQAKQSQTLITYTENRVTNAVESADAHRTPLPCETRSYELTGYTPTGPAQRFRPEDFVRPAPGDPEHLLHIHAGEVPYEATPVGERRRRLIEQARTLYRRDDLTGLLGLGELQPLALPGESHQLAFTPGLLEAAYVLDAQQLLPPDPSAILKGGGADRGGYVLSQDWKALGLFPDTDPNNHWWIPSGRVFLSPGSDDPPAQESDHATAHFFLPRRFRDPFHGGAVSTEGLVSYDAHDLLVIQARDAVGNTNRARNDYRVLQPDRLTGPNGNRSAVAFDALGLIVGTAVRGKESENLGDVLTENFKPNLTRAEIDAFMAAPLVEAPVLLDSATTRIVYDLHRFQHQGAPPVAATLARETHAGEPLPTGGLKIQLGFSYSDGFGREIQQKVQAEPGPLEDDGPIVEPRWVGSGWTIFNNKGAPVRQYEPFFDDTHAFRFARQVGVSPILFYDPVGRVVATLNPDHGYAKTVFDPWRQESWDANDTVAQTDPRLDTDVGAHFQRLPEAEFLPVWLTHHSAGTQAEQQAAAKALIHADTPAVTYLDSLGRSFLSVAHNRFERDQAIVEEHLASRVALDIEGNEREVRDALDRAVMRYDYDLLGNPIHQASMEAGERWMLNDAAGTPIRAWDSRGFAQRMSYDALRRPLGLWNDGGQGEWLAERFVYGEDQGGALNHRGQVYRVYDGAGVVTSEAYDFKGNPLRGSRRLNVDYKQAPDWSAAPPLESNEFTSETRFDALNRPVEITAPDGSRVRPDYNEANLLETIEADLRGEATTTAFVTGIDYDAKGQRMRIAYGNGTLTSYDYDQKTFRLRRLTTTRSGVPADQRTVQDLSYSYDPVGNITHIQDDAQQAIYFNNQHVEPSTDYVYDALYRLIEASGREHLGLAADNTPLPPKAAGHSDAPRIGRPHPGDGQAIGRYTQSYVYDAVGNFLQLAHRGSDPAHPGWSREYRYEEPSLLGGNTVSNRLSRTIRNGSDGQTATESYTHDAHGNMTAMPHLPLMRWNPEDELQASARQVVADGGTPETTYYLYDAAGQRVRKVTERQAAAGQAPTRMKERIYLGGFEVFREYDGGGETRALERETLHIMDDQARIALVETKTRDADEGGVIASPTPVLRYQFGNHLGSASLELDEAGAVISYEEHYPYGSTAYQAGRNAAEVSRKRYRYTGKERDEETGLYYHGARYYASWLGRWTAADPVGLVDGANVYAYVRGSPVGLVDPGGTQGRPLSEDEAFMLQHHIICGNCEEGEERGDSRIEGIGIQDIGEGGPGLETPSADSVTHHSPDDVVPFDPYADPNAPPPDVFLDPNAYDWIDSFFLRHAESVQNTLLTVSGLAATLAISSVYPLVGLGLSTLTAIQSGGENDPHNIGFVSLGGAAGVRLPKSSTGTRTKGPGKGKVDQTTGSETAETAEKAIRGTHQPLEPSRVERILRPSGKKIGVAGTGKRIRKVEGGKKAAQKFLARLLKGAKRLNKPGSKAEGFEIGGRHPGKIFVRTVGKEKGVDVTVDINIPGIGIDKIKFLTPK